MLRHFLRKLFKGAEVERIERPDREILVRYASGYIELMTQSGERIDIERDLYLQQTGKRDWKIYLAGGGSGFLLRNYTRENAIRYAADTVGSVLYVDDDNGFIFCRPKGLAEKRTSEANLV